MSDHSWTVLGLAIDIVGALLLSVEAVKLENIRAVQERVLVPISKQLFRLPKNVAAWWLAGSGVLFVLFVVSASIDELRWIDEPFEVGGLPAPLDFLARGVVGVLTIVLQIGVIFVAGQLALRMVAYASLLPIAVLSVIDRQTPAGTIGIVGVGLMVVGFVFQLLGA